jgi:hypothetical protein
MRNIGIVLLVLSGAVLVQATSSAMSRGFPYSLHQVNVFMGEFLGIALIAGLGLYFLRRGDQNRNKP